MTGSDELREFAYLHFSGSENVGPCDALMSIADRIDAETVELPKSADGKIWTGREVCFWTGATEGDWHKFHCLTCANGEWCVEDEHWQRYPAASAWYERPDSWERIADELDEMVDASDSADDRCEKLADLIDPTCHLVGTTLQTWTDGTRAFYHELSCGHTCETVWAKPPAFCNDCGARVVDGGDA